MNEEIYAFNTSWFDNFAKMTRKFQIRYFVESNQLEIIDLKSNKLFLKRTSCPPLISSKDFYLGSKVLIYGRNFEIDSYGDQYTDDKLGKKCQKTIAILKPDAYQNTGKIIDYFYNNGFTISALKLLSLSRVDAEELYSQSQGNPKFNKIVKHISSNAVTVIELVAEDCIKKLQQIISPLRSKYGTDDIANVLDGAENEREVERLTEFFFKKKHQQTATFNLCTCCVIQPHVVKDLQAGKIIDLILSQGYEISAMEMFQLDRVKAEEFLEVYKGVIPHFHDAVEQFTTGSCIAMELRATDPVISFRQTAGPWDIEMAKELRPNSIRAKFGIDRVKNAVHCTDLPEDAILECQYFFDILANQ